LEESKEKAQEYIQTVTNSQLDTIKTLISTGNDCFDAIVNTKIALCEKYGITARVRVMEKAIDNLPHDEIAILLGNMFDNAIEATKNSERKIIKLDVQIQDAYLSVCMKNSIDKSVLTENKKLNTTKGNNRYHGFGIKNIKRIVEKHSGLISYDEENGYFICDILLPI
jgi:sensor histidine kinase regulating citrate/malate metabolism